MTREELFESDIGEQASYNNAHFETMVYLPITRKGFEALLSRAASLLNLPVDDLARSVLAGYVHHIENDKRTVSMETVCNVLHKSMSNGLTWLIDQEIKAKARKEAQEKAEKEKVLREKSESDNVVSIETH